MHYRLAEPPDEHAARIFREVRASLAEHPEFQRDREKLMQVCCAPTLPVQLAGAATLDSLAHGKQCLFGCVAKSKEENAITNRRDRLGRGSRMFIEHQPNHSGSVGAKCDLPDNISLYGACSITLSPLSINICPYGTKVASCKVFLLHSTAGPPRNPPSLTIEARSLE